MKKQEFEQLVGTMVSDEEYNIIEKVYQFHPSIRETSGKVDVVVLYKSFGMTIFYDMLPRAEKYCELEQRLREVQAEMDQIRAEIQKLSYCTSAQCQKGIYVGRTPISGLATVEEIRQSMRTFHQYQSERIPSIHSEDVHGKQRA